MAEPRSGWENRKPGYRSRLIGAGRSGKLTGEPMTEAQTRAYWERGGDLRGGRSHYRAPVGSAPREATERESAGLGDAGTYKELTRWRKGAPAHLRANDNVLSTDTAAILSRVSPPSRWKSVQAEYLTDGTVILRIQPKGNAYPQTAVFPDASSASEVMALLRAPGKHSESKREKRRLEEGWGIKGQPVKVEKPIYAPGVYSKTGQPPAAA